MTPKEKYTLEVETYRDPTQSEASWDQLLCKVMEAQEDGSKKQIGQFVRNYSSLYNTWEPFEQDGKAFALCSPDYVGTAVMALPSCEIIAQEEAGAFGFCPTGFYVPTHTKDYAEDAEPELEPRLNGLFGFVCGCIWGDDSSWKIQFLDLSEISQGKLTRDDRFGYKELPGGSHELSDYVYVSYVLDGPRFVIHIVSDNYYCCGTKWVAKIEDKDVDVNNVIDEATDYITKFAATEKKLDGPTFREIVYATLRGVLTDLGVLKGVLDEDE
jgi:hypothetical protein